MSDNNMNRCWLCGDELTDDNQSKEHIIPNGIGGRLKSNKLLCKICNTRMGDSSDASLCDDLRFYVEMFQINRERNKELKGRVMTDTQGDEIIVCEAGQKLTLRRQFAEITHNDDGSQTIKIRARNEKELKKILDSYVNKGKIQQDKAQEILASAKMQSKSEPLKIQLCVQEKSFASIMKTLANFYVHKTKDISAVNNLKQFLLEGKDLSDRISITTLDSLRLSPDYKSIYHTLVIKGSPKTGLVGVAEFFNTYSYGVILNENYAGPDVYETYCFDVINKSEVLHKPSIDISADILKSIKQQFHQNPYPCHSELKFRADQVMKLWDAGQMDIEIHDTIDRVLRNEVGEGGIITEEAINKLSDAIINDIIIRRLNMRFPN